MNKHVTRLKKRTLPTKAIIYIQTDVSTRRGLLLLRDTPTVNPDRPPATNMSVNAGYKMVHRLLSTALIFTVSIFSYLLNPQSTPSSSLSICSVVSKEIQQLNPASSGSSANPVLENHSDRYWFFSHAAEDQGKLQKRSACSCRLGLKETWDVHIRLPSGVRDLGVHCSWLKLESSYQDVAGGLSHPASLPHLPGSRI